MANKKSNFNAKAMEEKWLDYWEREKVYRFDTKTKKKVFSIDTPPPTVSGQMHIGHVASYSQTDFIARYKRMKGFEVFYPFGTDDNGLPTERLIERLKNVKSKSMSRKDFIELCLKTLKEILPEFVQDWKNLGISCDYDVYYSTIDDNSRKIAQKSFIELYKLGLVYRENFPTIYCPECQTPVAQAELEDKILPSKFNTLRFGVEGWELLIATTRPELLGACVAIFVHPDDERYKKLVGKNAIVPLYGREVPIIADSSAQMDKGTGVLMICSYGDKYDVDAIKRHKLESRIVLNKDGTMGEELYSGLLIKDARKEILNDLKQKNLLIVQKDIEHAINVHDKCGTAIEFLPTEQWFTKILDKKKELIKQGRKIKWFPEHMVKRYENWINGLEWDWSSSRERHFGVPIPFWVCKNCDEVILPAENELPVDPTQIKKKCPKCKSDAEPETKVLDTWLTSSLSPQIASSLVGGKIKIPYSLRPQAHDIIRTWAFYTIVKSLYHENEIPWKDIAISGFVTLGKEKMSKSKGNVVSPRIVMNNFGSDALRYWAASSRLGEDVDYQEKDLVAGKKFVTKILNASRFVFLNMNYIKKMPELVETDKLFLTELNRVIVSTGEAFENYNYSRAKLEIDNFFWKIFADNYLEIVKKRVYNGSVNEQESAFWTLYVSLFAIVRMFAPFVPFVAEEIYQEHFAKMENGKSIHLESWPSEIKLNKIDLKIWERMIEIISMVRQAKSVANKSMNSEIRLILPASDLKLLVDVLDDLGGVCGAVEVKEGEFGVKFV